LANITQLPGDLQKQIDNKMQEGYSLSMKGDQKAAATEWLELWEIIKKSMSQHQIKYVEDFDQAFQGRQSLFNWASDMVMDLTDASCEDSSFKHRKIDFLNEYVSSSKNKGEHNIREYQRAIAETYFEIGDIEEGEKQFQQLTQKYPYEGWMWIGWSDQYWIMAKDDYKDSEKAVSLLKQALEKEELEDRNDVLERLKDLYEELKMNQKAKELEEEFNKRSTVPKGGSEVIKESPEDLKSLKNNPIQSTKVGRNEPCPCGSGKKYKKCCGK